MCQKTHMAFLRCGCMYSDLHRLVPCEEAVKRKEVCGNMLGTTYEGKNGVCGLHAGLHRPQHHFMLQRGEPKFTQEMKRDVSHAQFAGFQEGHNIIQEEQQKQEEEHNFIQEEAKQLTEEQHFEPKTIEPPKNLASPLRFKPGQAQQEIWRMRMKQWKGESPENSGEEVKRENRKAEFGNAEWSSSTDDSEEAELYSDLEAERRQRDCDAEDEEDLELLRGRKEWST